MTILVYDLYLILSSTYFCLILITFILQIVLYSCLQLKFLHLYAVSLVYLRASYKMLLLSCCLLSSSINLVLQFYMQFTNEAVQVYVCIWIVQIPQCDTCQQDQQQHMYMYIVEYFFCLNSCKFIVTCVAHHKFNHQHF